MKVCSRYHEEICYEETKCPVCVRMDKIDEQDNEIKELTEALSKATEQASMFEKDCEDYRLEIERMNQS